MLETCWQFLVDCSNQIVATIIFMATIVAAVLIIP